MMVLLIFIILLVLLALTLAYLWHCWFELTNPIGWVPLPRQVLPTVVAALGLRPGVVVYDLGCGDGRILEAVMVAEPSAKCVGVENNMVLWAWLRLWGDKRIAWRQADLLKTNLTRVNCVVAYLNHDLNAKLEPVFRQQLRNATVVCIQYPLPNIPPVRRLALKEPEHAKYIFVYRF